jgi:hypothetical protein
MQPAAEAPREAKPLAIAILIFAALSLVAAITSDGFLEADGCTHYLYARYALLEPHYFVNVWGRPFWTMLYCIPGYFGGRLGVRVMSLAVAIAIALVARQIAKGQGWRWPVLALIFTFAQPLFFFAFFQRTDRASVCLPARARLLGLSAQAVLLYGRNHSRHAAQPARGVSVSRSGGNRTYITSTMVVADRAADPAAALELRRLASLRPAGRLVAMALSLVGLAQDKLALCRAKPLHARPTLSLRRVAARRRLAADFPRNDPGNLALP